MSKIKEKLGKSKTHSLLDMNYKNCLNNYQTRIVRDYREGFEEERFKIDQIRLQYNTFEENLSLRLLVIDFKQAFTL